MALDYTEYSWGYADEFTPDLMNNIEHGIKAASNAVNEVNNNLNTISTQLNNKQIMENDDLNNHSGFGLYWWAEMPINAPDAYCNMIVIGGYFTTQIAFRHNGGVYIRYKENARQWSEWTTLHTY